MKFFTSLPILTKIVLLFLGIFSFYIIFNNLGGPTLENWDEAWYGQMAREMISSKELVIPRWNYDYLFDKPPMYIWITVFLSYFLGLSEFSIRLTSAISGFVIILIILFYAYRKWGLIVSLIAFSTIFFNNIFIWRTRSGNIDVFLTLLIFLSYFLILSKRKSRFVLLGILFACIYLTKASIVLFPLSIFVLHEGIFIRKEIKNNVKEYLKLIAIFIGTSGFWLLFGYIKMGSEFVNYFLFKSDQEVSSINVLKFKTDYLNYAYYSLQRRYYYVFILGLIMLVVKIRNSTNFLIVLFAIALLALLSFTQKNNNWYLIPSMPFWSLVVAYAAYRVINFFKNSLFITIPTTLIIIFISYRTFTINIMPILNTYSSFDQAQSAKKINSLSKKDDIIIRLDHLYPATIYYSERKVLASPIESNTGKQFISRKDLIKDIKDKKITWLVGTHKDIDLFVENNAEIFISREDINFTESIIKIL